MFKMIQRNDFSAKFIYKENDIAKDVNGWEYIFVIKQENDNSPNDNKALLKKRVLIENSLNGIFFVNLTSQETNIAPGQYNTQLLLTRINPDNNLRQISTIFTDKVRVLENYVKEI